MYSKKFKSFLKDYFTLTSRERKGALALSFLILIGVMLVAEGTGQHMPKGYIYFAMAFSLGVELLNMKYRSAATKKVS